MPYLTPEPGLPCRKKRKAKHDQTDPCSINTRNTQKNVSQKQKNIIRIENEKRNPIKQTRALLIAGILLY